MALVLKRRPGDVIRLERNPQELATELAKIVESQGLNVIKEEVAGPGSLTYLSLSGCATCW